MRTDNMFYQEPGRSDDQNVTQIIRSEAVSYDELYNLWLLPKLLSTPPIKIYAKTLVDFAELVLDDAGADIDWFQSAGDYGLDSILGRSLEMAASTKQRREFSSVAMAFAGYKFELSYCGDVEYLGADAMCNELIKYMGWSPKYFRQVERGADTFLKGTKTFRRDSGLKVWLPYESFL
jgi:hypothetical protein